MVMSSKGQIDVRAYMISSTDGLSNIDQSHAPGQGDGKIVITERGLNMIEDTEEPIPVLVDFALARVADVEVGAIASLDSAVL